MPPFKEYRSEVGITTGRALTVTPSSIDTSGVSGAIRGVGEALLEAEKAMVRVRDFRETTEASNFLFDKTNAIKAVAENDIDFDSSRYELEIDKAITDAAKTITGRLAKEEFVAKAERQSISTKWSIKNMFRDRQFEAARASISYNRKQVLDTVGAMDEAGTITAIDGYRKVLEEGVAKGVIYKEFATFDLQKFEKDVAKSQADYHVLTNPEAALKELQQGEEGDFAEMPAEDRAKYISKAKTKIATLEAQRKRDNVAWLVSNRIEHLGKIATGEIDLESEAGINLTRNMYGPDFKLAEAMEKNALKGGFDLTDMSNEAFLKAAEGVFASGDTKQISDFLIGSLGNPTGISRDRMASLVYAAKKKAEELNKGEEKGFWSNLFDFFKGHSKFGDMSAMVNTIDRARVEEADDNRVEEIAKEEIFKQVDREKAGFPTFSSEKAAEDAGLPKGTIILINGKKAIVE